MPTNNEIPNVSYSEQREKDILKEFTPEEYAFFRDLETKRPLEEVNVLRTVFRQAVLQEYNRLNALTPEQREEEIITGDMPLITKHDRLKGTPELLSSYLAAEALVHRFYNLWILNHPTRVFSLKRFIEQGYRPPVKKKVNIIERSIHEQIALDFDDLGMIYDEPDPYVEPQVDSARKLLAHGPYTWLADNLAAIPYALSSMPDISNSLSISTHVLSGGLAFVPFDSKWNNVKNQRILVQRAWEMVQNDLVLQNHPDKEFLLEHRKRLIAPTLKVNESSIEEMLQYLREGFTTFRFYDARARSMKMGDLAEKLRKRLEDQEFDKIRDKITLFFGQVKGPKTSERIKKALGSFVGLGRIVGIGGGGICSTPKESNQEVTNVKDGYRMLQADSSFCTLFDGGVGDALPVVLAMGGSGVLKSQALVGGCLEQPPHLWYYRIANNVLAKLVSGEAGKRTKSEGGKIDFLYRPLFVEGADAYSTMNPDAISMTDNTYSLLQSLSTAMIFAQVSEIYGFWSMPEPPIGTATERAKLRASVHQQGGNDKNLLRDVFPDIPLTYAEELAQH